MTIHRPLTFGPPRRFAAVGDGNTLCPVTRGYIEVPDEYQGPWPMRVENSQPERTDAMAMIEIKCRFSGKVLWSGEYASTKAAVEAAVKAGASLAGASLAGASLAGASLARASLARASLDGAYLDGITGTIRDSHEILAHLAIRFDVSLTPVAAMILGRVVGCWSEYTAAIRQYFGEDVMLRLREAWSQDIEWGVIERMDKHGWPKNTSDASVADDRGT